MESSGEEDEEDGDGKHKDSRQNLATGSFPRVCCSTLAVRPEATKHLLNSSHIEGLSYIVSAASSRQKSLSPPQPFFQHRSAHRRLLWLGEQELWRSPIWPRGSTGLGLWGAGRQESCARCPMWATGALPEGEVAEALMKAPLPPGWSVTGLWLS